MRRRKWFAAAALGLAAFMASACQKMETGDGEKELGTVEIPVIFQIDPASDHKSNEELMEAFNEEYEGTYHISVQWMFDTTSAYRAQLKLLNVTDELPAVMTDVAFSPAFYQLLTEDERLLNLAPYFEGDEEWKSLMDPDTVELCREEDGAVYMMPISSNCFSYSGIFYNRELFKEAGIEQFPRTWEELWECCEKLEKKGITPLALHTKGTAWAPMLLATAALGMTEDGAAFLNQRLPGSYEGYGEQMAGVLKKAFSYTTPDAANYDFDVAYEHFIKEEAAMLPNGYWMLGQLGEELTEKIGFAPFPGNVMVVSPQMSGWAVAADYPEEVRKGAVEFLKFRTFSTKAQAEEFLSDEKIAASRLEEDYLAAVKGNPRSVSNYQIQWNPILQEEMLPEAIEKLARGELDEAGFAEALNDSVARYERER